MAKLFEILVTTSWDENGDLIFGLPKYALVLSQKLEQFGFEIKEKESLNGITYPDFFGRTFPDTIYKFGLPIGTEDRCIRMLGKYCILFSLGFVDNGSMVFDRELPEPTQEELNFRESIWELTNPIWFYHRHIRTRNPLEEYHLNMSVSRRGKND